MPNVLIEIMMQKCKRIYDLFVVLQKSLLNSLGVEYTLISLFEIRLPDYFNNRLFNQSILID